MKTILIAGLAVIVPALAQSPDEAITQYRATVDGLNLLELQARAGERLYMAGATVKNAPYSADAMTETTQALTDGNRIVQRTTQKLYRDSDGRERREESVLATGALAQTEMPRTITISDPVERVSYTLDLQQRTARRRNGAMWLTGEGITLSIPLRGTTGQVVLGGRGGAQAAPGAQSVKEDLGSKNIEGVIAQGTRTTQTIPAGQIGNQLPIKVVDEVWHSSELQMDVLTTHSDPRSGEVTYKLTNISRANPPRTLFEPPVDYTVTGPAAGGGRSGPAGADPGAARGGGRGAARGPQ
jgi:hypothetical protein